MTDPAIQEIQAICERSGGRSLFFEKGSSGYMESIRFWLDSSGEEAEAVVRPGSEEDLSKIIKVLAKRNASPGKKLHFGIKGGGHATRPGMSSTRGIQIDMCLFNDVQYDSAAQCVKVGAGCLWEDVYDVVLNCGCNVTGGGRKDGVGVAGWLVGGGYSLKTNQHGLGIDNIVSFRVVLPNGDVMSIGESDEENRDLFIALKGGGNNFGIVTQFILKTHKQVETTHGGLLLIRDEYLDEFKKAIIKFVKTVKQPEAAIVAAFRYVLEYEVKPSHKTLCFFDGDPGLESPFKDFEDISEKPKPDHTGHSPSRLREMPFTLLDAMFSSRFDLHVELDLDLDLDYFAAVASSKIVRGEGMAKMMYMNDRCVTSGKTSTTGGNRAKAMYTNARGRFGCIMVTGFTQNLVDVIAEEARRAADKMKDNGGKLVLIEIWPFLPHIFKNSPPAAWPHTVDKAFGPLIAYFLWNDKEKDKFWVKTMTDALGEIRKVAIQEKCTSDDLPLYTNACLEGHATPEAIYGNMLKDLTITRRKYDPNGVMNNTGGVKIPISNHVGRIE